MLFSTNKLRENNNYDIMSASELGRAKLSHNERRMTIMNEVHDILHVDVEYIKIYKIQMRVRRAQWQV